jgi:DNA-binding CsgD family transcriptional regulator
MSLGLRTDDLRSRLEFYSQRAASGRSTVVWLVGAPGLGKSTTLRAVRDRLELDNWTVLSTRGQTNDADLAFSSLLTLFRPVVADLDALAGDVAGELRTAMELGRDAVDPIAVQLGVFRVLASLSEARPLAVLIDDADDVDAATARALAFALGRLDADAILTVMTCGEALPTALRSLDAETIVMAPLDAAELRGVIADVADVADVADSVLDEIVERSHGNPLLARETLLALDAAQRRGETPIPAIVRPGGGLHQGFRARLDALDERGRRALVVVAADDAGDVSAIRDALERLGEDGGGIDAAVSAGLLDVASGRVTFNHPLLRAVAYHHVAPASRRAAHRALAASYDRPDQAARRAWQLAEAAEGYDPDAARALMLVADHEIRRGAPVLAARAIERASTLEIDSSAVAARLARAAELRVEGGEDERALALVDGLLLDGEVDLDTAETVVAVLEAARAPVPELVATWRAAASAASVVAGLERLLTEQQSARQGRWVRRREFDDARPIRRAPRVIEAVRSAIGAGDTDGAVTRLRQTLAVGIAGARWRTLLTLMLRSVEHDLGVPITDVDIDVARIGVARAEQARDGLLLRAALGVVVRVGSTSEVAAASEQLDRMGADDDVATPRPKRSTIAPSGAPMHQLSVAEMRVARCVSEGRTNREAAEELFVSRKTVDFHLQQIFRKLAIRTRTELAVLVSQGAVVEAAAVAKEIR